MRLLLKWECVKMRFIAKMGSCENAVLLWKELKLDQASCYFPGAKTIEREKRRDFRISFAHVRANCVVCVTVCESFSSDTHFFQQQFLTRVEVRTASRLG